MRSLAGLAWRVWGEVVWPTGRLAPLRYDGGGRLTGPAGAIPIAGEMNEGEPFDEVLQHLEAAASGDREARARLIELSSQRLQLMARSMLRQFPVVRRWEETDDVWQSALLRLWKSLESCQPESPRHFLNLAALQIRRQLIELARHYTGAQGLAQHHATPAPQSSDDATPDLAVDETHEASQLAAWTEIHEQVEQLPQDEREVFTLIWYQGMTQPQVAELLGISVRTVKRRWQAARLQLHDEIERSFGSM